MSACDLCSCCQAQMRSGKFSRRPTIKTSCSTSSRTKAFASTSRCRLTWGRAATLTCLLWWPTTRRATRSAGWCLDPVRCPTADSWGGTAVLKICSMSSCHQEQVSSRNVGFLSENMTVLYTWPRSLYCVLPERQVQLRLNYSKYGGLLTEDNLIRLGALLFDYATTESTLAVRTIVLENPEIKVRVSTINPDNYCTAGGDCTRSSANVCRFADPGWAEGEAQAGCGDHPPESPAGDAGRLLLQHRGGQPHWRMCHLWEVRGCASSELLNNLNTVLGKQKLMSDDLLAYSTYDLHTGNDTGHDVFKALCFIIVLSCLSHWHICTENGVSAQ